MLTLTGSVFTLWDLSVFQSACSSVCAHAVRIWLAVKSPSHIFLNHSASPIDGISVSMAILSPRHTVFVFFDRKPQVLHPVILLLGVHVKALSCP